MGRPISLHTVKAQTSMTGERMTIQKIANVMSSIRFM